MLLYLLIEYYNSGDGKLHINPNSVLLAHKLRMIFKLDWKKIKRRTFHSIWKLYKIQIWVQK